MDCSRLERVRLLSGRCTRTWKEERGREKHCNYSTEGSLMVGSQVIRLGFDLGYISSAGLLLTTIKVRFYGTEVEPVNLFSLIGKL